MRPQQLREALETLGVSQVQLGRDLGVSGRAVRHWLAGTYRIPAVVVRVVVQSIERGYYRAPRQS